MTNLKEQDIQLTPAELELIKLKREKEELTAKEDAVKAAIQVEKDILKQKEYIAAFHKVNETQHTAAKKYLAAFEAKYPGLYE